MSAYTEPLRPYAAFIVAGFFMESARLSSYFLYSYGLAVWRLPGFRHIGRFCKAHQSSKLGSLSIFRSAQERLYGTILGINYSVERLCNRCVYLASFIVTSSNIRSRSHDSAQGLPRRTRLKGEYRDAPPLQFMMRILTDSGAFVPRHRNRALRRVFHA